MTLRGGGCWPGNGFGEGSAVRPQGVLRAQSFGCKRWAHGSFLQVMAGADASSEERADWGCRSEMLLKVN